MTRRVQERDRYVTCTYNVARFVRNEARYTDTRHFGHPFHLCSLNVDRYRTSLQQRCYAVDPKSHHRATDMVGVVVRGQYAAYRHAIELDFIDKGVDIVSRIHEQTFTGLPISYCVHKIDHLSCEIIVSREVPPREKLPKIQTWFAHFTETSGNYP